MVAELDFHLARSLAFSFHSCLTWQDINYQGKHKAVGKAKKEKFIVWPPEKETFAFLRPPAEMFATCK